MANSLIEAARKRKAEQERKDAVQRDRQKAFNEAIEELEARTFRVSMPDYHAKGGKDSHIEIQRDREALIEYQDSLDGEPDMMPPEPQKSTDELLAEIRDSLGGDRGGSK